MPGDGAVLAWPQAIVLAVLQESTADFAASFQSVRADAELIGGVTRTHPRHDMSVVLRLQPSPPSPEPIG